MSIAPRKRLSCLPVSESSIKKPFNPPPEGNSDNSNNDADCKYIKNAKPFEARPLTIDKRIRINNSKSEALLKEKTNSKNMKILEDMQKEIKAMLEFIDE